MKLKKFKERLSFLLHECGSEGIKEFDRLLKLNSIKKRKVISERKSNIFTPSSRLFTLHCLGMKLNEQKKNYILR